jgi:hypothetical protein
MARSYHFFGDIAGQLSVPRVECTRCQRKGRYRVAKLIAQYGCERNMSEWMSEPKVDCPKRGAPQLHERCDLILSRSAEGALGANRAPAINCGFTGGSAARAAKSVRGTEMAVQPGQLTARNSVPVVLDVGPSVPNS